MGKIFRRILIVIFGLSVIGGVYSGPPAVAFAWTAVAALCVYFEIKANNDEKAETKSSSVKNKK